jgi:hypothetical protein
MPLSIQRSERIARTGPRALLRARLLNIVGAGPEVVGGRGGRVTGAAQDARPSLLLLNPDRSDLDVEDFVRTIRQRYPKLEVVVVEAAVHVHDLPCEFGNGALKASRNRRSRAQRRQAGEVRRSRKLRTDKLTSCSTSSISHWWAMKSAD